MAIDTIKRNIAIARRQQTEITTRNPDYIEERGEDAKRFYELEMDLIELENRLSGLPDYILNEEQ
jgi:hypothetical protein